MNNLATTKSYSVAGESDLSATKSYSVAGSQKRQSYIPNRDNDESPDDMTRDITDPYERMSRLPNELSLPEEFLVEFEAMSSERAHKYHARYLRAVTGELINRAKFKRGMSIQFGLKEVNDKCSTFMYNKVRYSIWSVFHKIQPIITTIDKGNNMTKQVTNAMISDKYYDLLISTADAIQIMELWFGKSDHSQFRFVPVDMVSLEHFIMNSDDAIGKGGSAAYVSKLKRNRRHAQMIQLVANYMVSSGISETPVWPHMPKMSEYGRQYYRGLSLQSVHRELRRAALGGYYYYDLNAAVYAIKLMIVEDVYADIGVDIKGQYPYTQDYLDTKSGRRRNLAKHIQNYPDGVRLVKQAITAIGFGAKLQSAAWVDDNNEQKLGAITDIIKNESDRNRFMNDPWVVEFVKEQERMTTEIYEWWVRNDSFRERMMLVPNALSPSGKLKKSAVVAYLFQHTERAIMSEVFGDMDYTIDIHDAVVSKGKLDLLTVRERLNSISQWLEVEEEHKNGYYNVENDREVMAHRAFIAQEERDAAEYYGSHTRPGKVWRERGDQSVDLNVRADSGARGEVIASHLWA